LVRAPALVLMKLEYALNRNQGQLQGMHLATRADEDTEGDSPERSDGEETGKESNLKLERYIDP
jgi:hypothetical protein